MFHSQFQGLKILHKKVPVDSLQRRSGAGLQQTEESWPSDEARVVLA